MANFNQNNPTVNWTDEEKYELCKLENKWLKELQSLTGKRQTGRVCDSKSDPTFSSTAEINEVFQKDIDEKMQKFEHRCHLCDYASSVRSSVTGHIRDVHNRSRSKCDQCDKTFSKYYMKQHIKLKHQSTNQNLICKLCSKIFANGRSLKLHAERYHAEKTLPCNDCPMMFATKGTLNHHKKSVHVFASLKCPHCIAKFKLKYALEKHIKSVHTGDKVMHSCSLCSYVTGNKGHLKRHKGAVHDKTKNWSCKACSYSCHTKEHLKNHMRTHTGEQPFHCKKCSTRFSEAGNLRRHSKTCNF